MSDLFSKKTNIMKKFSFPNFNSKSKNAKKSSQQNNTHYAGQQPLPPLPAEQDDWIVVPTSASVSPPPEQGMYYANDYMVASPAPQNQFEFSEHLDSSDHNISRVVINSPPPSAISELNPISPAFNPARFSYQVNPSVEFPTNSYLQQLSIQQSPSVSETYFPRSFSESSHHINQQEYSAPQLSRSSSFQSQGFNARNLRNSIDTLDRSVKVKRSNSAQKSDSKKPSLGKLKEEKEASPSENDSNREMVRKRSHRRKKTNSIELMLRKSGEGTSTSRPASRNRPASRPTSRNSVVGVPNEDPQMEANLHRTPSQKARLYSDNSSEPNLNKRTSKSYFNPTIEAEMNNSRPSSPSSLHLSQQMATSPQTMNIAYAPASPLGTSPLGTSPPQIPNFPNEYGNSSFSLLSQRPKFRPTSSLYHTHSMSGEHNSFLTQQQLLQYNQQQQYLHYQQHPELYKDNHHVQNPPQYLYAPSVSVQEQYHDNHLVENPPQYLHASSVQVHEQSTAFDDIFQLDYQDSQTIQPHLPQNRPSPPQQQQIQQQQPRAAKQTTPTTPTKPSLPVPPRLKKSESKKETEIKQTTSKFMLNPGAIGDTLNHNRPTSFLVQVDVEDAIFVKDIQKDIPAKRLSKRRPVSMLKTEESNFVAVDSDMESVVDLLEKSKLSENLDVESEVVEPVTEDNDTEIIMVPDDELNEVSTDTVIVQEPVDSNSPEQSGATTVVIAKDTQITAPSNPSDSYLNSYFRNLAYQTMMGENGVVVASEIEKFKNLKKDKQEKYIELVATKWIEEYKAKLKSGAIA